MTTEQIDRPIDAADVWEATADGDGHEVVPERDGVERAERRRRFSCPQLVVVGHQRRVRLWRLIGGFGTSGKGWWSALLSQDRIGSRINNGTYRQNSILSRS